MMHATSVPNQSGKPAIVVRQVDKFFPVAQQQVQVLKQINLEVKTGDFVVILGPSGCGKSTLLHVMLGLEPPSQGKINVLGRDMYALSEDQKADFRKRHIGMVYQQPHWIKALNVIENVAFPLALLGVSESERLSRATELLRMVNMENWATYLPSELSSGQQQRISLIRALITNPELIMADEPTGNLDYESGLQLMELLKTINEQTGKTVLMVTHDLEYMKYARQAIRLLDGQVVETMGETQINNNHIHSKRGEHHA